MPTNKQQIQNQLINYLEEKKQKEDLAKQIDTQAQIKVDLRLSSQEKNNLLDNLTLSGQRIYHEAYKPRPEDINAVNEDEVNSLIDNRISTKVGNDTEISNIKQGKKADGTYISKTNVGLANVDNKSFTEIRSDIQKSIGVQLIENDWTIGSGATSFYNVYGSNTESYRVYGINHKGETAILWECRPDGNVNQDGGWNTDDVNIDKTKTYRFSVFIKTSANTGTTYFGCGINTVCTLNTTTKVSNPYFWYGDLPENNKWYLLVGYVFPASQSGLSLRGGIYNCETGAQEANIQNSFNWATDAVLTLHRCYHHNGNSATTRQWMFQPRIDLIDGNEPTILALIGKISIDDIPSLPTNKITGLDATLASLENRIIAVEDDLER